MNVAANRGLRKAIRTIVQVAAGGALTALVTALAGGVSPRMQALIMGAWTAFVAFAQNWAETAGRIPTLLPSPGLVVGTDVAVATVDAVADEAGSIVGDVTDTAGEIVGTVVGAVVPDDLDDDQRGSVPLAVLILVGLAVTMILGLALCGDAMFEDEDEVDDLGVRTELVSRDRGDRDDSSDGSGECADSRGQCSDDDLSPRFDDSPIIICLRPDSCRFDSQGAT